MDTNMDNDNINKKEKRKSRGDKKRKKKKKKEVKRTKKRKVYHEKESGKDGSDEAFVSKMRAHVPKDTKSKYLMVEGEQEGAMVKRTVGRTDPNTYIKIESKKASQDEEVLKPTEKTYSTSISSLARPKNEYRVATNKNDPKRDAVKCVQGYIELVDSSEENPEDADDLKPVVVYGNVLEGITTDNEYKCLEDEGKCGIIADGFEILKQEVAFRNVFHKMNGSSWSEEALECFEKSRDDGLFNNMTYRYPGLEIDHRALLLMTTPVRFARMKVVDLKAVSSKYNINEHFRRALRESGSVTVNAFPFLNANKKSKPGRGRGYPNLNNLLKASQRKIMFFVVRLHYANHIFHVMEQGTENAFEFDFINYPELKLVLTELEKDLANMVLGTKHRMEGAIKKKCVINKSFESGMERKKKIVAAIGDEMVNLCKAIIVMASPVTIAMKRIRVKLTELANVDDKTEMTHIIDRAVEANIKTFQIIQNKLH